VEVDDTEESFIAAIRLPLTRAARIDIVDRYLLPTNMAYGRLLERILKEIVHNPRNPRIRIHSSLEALTDKSEDKYDREIWKMHFSHLHGLLLKQGRAGQVLIWRPKDLPDKFHDRYLLTELGSCSVGRGFQIQHGCTNRLYLLDQSLHEILQYFYKADENAKKQPCIHPFRIGSEAFLSR